MTRIKLLCKVTIAMEERHKLASEAEFEPGDVELEPGRIIEIDAALARQLLENHAELAEPDQVETAAKAAPQNAMKRKAKARKPARE